MAEMPEGIGPARRAAREYRDTLARFPNVIGSGVGYRTVAGRETEEFSLVAFVTRKLPKSALRSDEIIPREIPTSEGGVPTDVIETAEPRLLADTNQYRPVIGGCSIVSVGNGGTLGGNLYDRTDLQPVLLTCNHVVTIAGQRTYIPDDNRIWQPSSMSPFIGRTKRIVPMFRAPLGATWTFEATVDAGIIAPNPEIGVSFNIIELGRHPFVILPAYPGLEVTKRGATTERTSGTVKHIDVAFTSTDTNGHRLKIGGTDCVFTIKLIGGNFAMPGDSGALVVDSELGSARGMVFAGETNISGHTYACDLDAVFSMLQLQTSCTGSLHGLVSRAVLRRHVEAWSASMASGNGLVQEMIRKVDRFRDVYLPKSMDSESAGIFASTLQMFAADLAEAVHQNEDFAGLVDEAIGDWLALPTVYDMLEYRLPDDFGQRILKAFECLKEEHPAVKSLAPVIAPMLKQSGGMKMRELLGTISLKAPAGRKK
jgi:hypothetical protein